MRARPQAFSIFGRSNDQFEPRGADVVIRPLAAGSSADFVARDLAVQA